MMGRSYPSAWRKSKYGNQKITIDSITFDSLKEAGRYNDLKLLARAGKITNLTLQKAFILLDPFTDNEGKKHNGIKYVCDFFYTDANGVEVVEDVKSEITRKDKVYIIKKKLFLFKYQQYKFQEI